MTARAEVVSMLAGALPADIDVIGYSRAIDPPVASTVMVRVDKVRNSAHALGLREYEFTLVCIAYRTTAGPADDELDLLLEDVFYALSKNDIPNSVVVGTAERGTFPEPDGSNPSFEVPITVTFAIDQ